MTSKRPSNRFSGPFLVVPRWVLNYLHNDGSTALILMHLMMYLDSDTQQVWASYNTLTKNSGLSKSTVMRSINKLCEIGVLIKTRRSVAGRNAPNLYTVNFNNPSAHVLPGGVTHDTRGVVSPMTPPSVTHDTIGSVTHDTTNKSKEQEEKIKKGGNRVDRRLFE